MSHAFTITRVLIVLTHTVTDREKSNKSNPLDKVQ